MNEPGDRPISTGLLLIPGFSLMAYASAVEPLRAANRVSGQQLYEWHHVSIDGAPAQASNGIAIQPNYRIGDEIRFDYLFVCAGGNPAQFHHPATFSWLRQLARRGVSIGGISGGPYILARANLLTGYRFTIHWEHASAFVEDYPELDLRRSLYEIDRDRLTSGGGTAALDMMHALITRQHGQKLAMAVSEWFLQTQIREGTGPQRMTLRERLGVSHEPLLHVIERMERHIEEPLQREELAEAAGVSLRQLERQFRKHLGSTLGEYYLQLRLERARHLLRQTTLSVLEVALACGFQSASHFARAYRARHGRPPRDERIACGSTS